MEDLGNQSQGLAIKPEESPGLSSQPGLQQSVARGTAALVGAQFLTAPISIVLNMLLTRRLGAEEFGTLFLAGNLAGLAFLFVDWGQTTSIAGITARDSQAAPRLLGTGLLLKLAASFAAAGVLWVLATILSYSPQVQLALAITSLQSALVTLAASYGAVLRGYDRLGQLSQLTVLGSVLNFALVVPVLLFGGHLLSVLVAQCVGSAVALALYVWRIHQLGVQVQAPNRASASQLFQMGSGFLLLGVVLALQPALDSVFLSKLAPPEVVGWYSAARRFVGFLIFPATTLNYAIYPTLCRLLNASRADFLELTRSALRAVMIFGVPAAVGCALYASLVIHLFSGPAFAAATPVLQMLSVFVFLVYFSIILSAALAALNQQLRWAVAQLACVAVSAIGDPLMVPWCQHRFGNGAIGISITSVVSEILMVAAGMWIAPPGLFDRSVVLATGRCLGAGVAMAGTALVAAHLPWPVSLCLSVAAYVATLALLGGLKREQIELFIEVVRRRTSRQPGRAANSRV